MTLTFDAVRSAAAEARAAAMRAHADRPSSRRNGDRADAPAVVRVPARLEIREASEGDGKISFTGYASVTEEPYTMYDMFGPYTEQVLDGAFDKTLAQDDLDVPLVLQHQDLRRIARTTNGSLQLIADDIGLRVEAPDLDIADADVAYIVPKIRAGLIDEMSFKFRIDKGSWSPDWEEFHIHAVDIHRGDVAIVGYGANPATSAQLRASDMPGLIHHMTDDAARVAYAELSKRFTTVTTADTLPRTRVRLDDDDTRLRTLR